MVDIAYNARLVAAAGLLNALVKARLDLRLLGAIDHAPMICDIDEVINKTLGN